MGLMKVGGVWRQTWEQQDLGEDLAPIFTPAEHAKLAAFFRAHGETQKLQNPALFVRRSPRRVTRQTGA